MKSRAELEAPSIFLLAKAGLMLTGKRFRLERATLAVEQIDGKRRAVTVSVGEIIKVVAGPTNRNGMVDILWGQGLVEMFAVDVTARGTEITDLSAGA